MTRETSSSLIIRVSGTLPGWLRSVDRDGTNHNHSRGARTLGLFNHLIPPKGKIWVTFDKATFAEGEAVVGKVNVQAHEYIQGQGIKLEARVFETYQEPVWVTINNTRVQEMHRVENVLYSQDVQVTGPSDFGEGNSQTFPFSVGIPPCRATRGGAAVENSLKAILQCKGRPHLTGGTQVPIMPPGAMPQQGYMQGGYPVQQGYGPQGYNQGYNPNPGYGPPMPGYGQQMPGYNMPPQMPQQQVQQIRCKYCQGMMAANASTCPNCGAHQ